MEITEVSAEDCKKDPNCVTVKVTVIYDPNANGGKGLTDDQKKAFEAQVQKAKDQYGNADIHLDVSYHSPANCSAWGEEGLVLVPKTAGASAIQMEGKGMSIMRRQPDGSWKFARGINSTLPRALDAICSILGATGHILTEQSQLS